MKKILFMLGLIALIFTALPAVITNADSIDNNPTSVTVLGKVTNNNVAVSGATVNVKCQVTTISTTTNTQGSYIAVFEDQLCASGNTVIVTAISGGLSGTNRSTVVGSSCYSNITIINVSIPEFGTTTTLSAAAAGGAFLVMRRRNRGENKV